MSSDEYDPLIERLFAQTPAMSDAPLFAAGVEDRLNSGSRVRTLALSLAGLVGGVVAVRQTMTLDLNVVSRTEPVATRVIGRGIDAVTLNAQDAVQSGLDQFGLNALELGSMGGMHLFWMAAAALIAVAAAGAVRLSQDI